MKSLCLSLVCIAVVSMGGSGAPSAQACDGYGMGAGYAANYGYGYFPGFGVPDCISVRTPPYFAVHPPVYYSTRYARPYGISPFAAPPMVHVPDAYKARLVSEFVRPPLSNPYCCASEVVPGNEVPAESVPEVEAIPEGQVRLNPFVSATAKVAQRD